MDEMRDVTYKMLGRSVPPGITLDTVMDMVESGVKLIFSVQGTVRPAWHLVTADHMYYVAVTSWKDEEEKLATVEAMRRFIADRGVTIMALVAEAWQAEVASREEAFEKAGHVDQMPGRQEIVFVTGEDSTRCVQTVWEVVRAGGEKPTLRELGHRTAAREQEGSMVGFLRPTSRPN